MILDALRLAVAEAAKFRGATSPNPPVGACALDEMGRVIGVAAHHRAGEAHAERELLALLASRGVLDQLHTMVVTLEPCSHQGRTPPCTDALKSSQVRRVVFALRDPNPRAAGGAQVLLAAGIDVECLEDGPNSVELESARLQLGPFLKVQSSGMPWVTVKQVVDASGSMIPPPGRKTFSSRESLQLAHELRRRADAILTGSGTILADRPEFTVRHVKDHPGKRRQLWVADRRGQVAERQPEYFSEAADRNFEVKACSDWRAELKTAASQGVMEVLVEAGPLLTGDILQSGLWDEHWVIQVPADSGPDQVRHHLARSMRSTS